MSAVKEVHARPDSWFIRCPYCEFEKQCWPGTESIDENLNEHGNWECPECGKKSRYKGIEV